MGYVGLLCVVFPKLSYIRRQTLVAHDCGSGGSDLAEQLAYAIRVRIRPGARDLLCQCVRVALAMSAPLPASSCFILPCSIIPYSGNSFDVCRYYIHPPASLFTKPLLLVPERQVQTLVDEINSAFHMSIKLPRDPFLLAFYQDGTPAPIHIGISQSRDAVQNMEQGVPPPSGEYGVCPSDASPELERFFEHFKAKMERAVAAQKRKGVAMKKARAKHRLASLVTRYEALKRGQRYLGLRPRDCIGGLPVPDSSLPWDEQLKCEREQRIKYGHILRPLDVDQVAPHPFDRDVVFVSVDVEAFERAQNLITEVGISTLDTADIKSLAPGHGGVNWMECIRSRHFRISNHAHLRNTSFCIGDPEKFLFGRSEFVSVNEVGKAVDSCFQPPYSAGFVHDGRFQARDKTSGRNIQIDPIDQQLRNISLESQQSAQRDISSSQLSNESVDLQGPENENENEERDLANEIAVSGIHSPTELTEDVKVAKHCSETDSSRRVSAADMATTEDRQSSEQQSSLRNVILVGHSVDADLQFLSTLGSKVFHEPPAPVHPRTLKIEDPLRQHILETLDTANLYQVWKCETNTSSLAKVLVEVERTGWHLHNGGNDARYTLEAMIGILIRSRQQEDEVSKAVSADGTAGSEGEKQHLEEKLAGTIRRRQEAVEREERENAAIWTHAIGPYGEGVEVLPDPYSQQGGRPDQQQHRQELGTGAIADAPTDHPAQSTVNEAAGPYSWSSCPRASRDGGEPKGFKIPTSKLEKAKSSSKRRKEVSKLQEEGEIDGPCDWGTEGKDGW